MSDLTVSDDRIPLRYAIYNDDGSIRQYGMCHRNSITAMSSHGGTFVELTPDIRPELTWYDHTAGAVASKTAFPVTLHNTVVAVDSPAILSGIPAGTRLFVDGEEVTPDDGTVEISFGRAGMYRVSMKHVQYLDWENSIEAQG